MVEGAAKVLEGIRITDALELRRRVGVFTIIYNAEINRLLEKLFQGGGLKEEKFWVGAYADDELARAHLRVFERRRLDWLFLLCLCVFLLPPREYPVGDPLLE